MAFEISPLQFWEIDEYTRLRYTTFAASDASLNGCFFPDGWSPNAHLMLRRGTEKAIHDPDDHFLLVRDTATKEVVGGAEWEVQREPKSVEAMLEEERRAEEERASMPQFEGVNHAGLNAFRKVQAQCHREVMQGRAQVYLSMLVVKPEHQRRGVGKEVMQWGLRMADELGLPAYLEATKAGKPLYEKYGFKVDRMMPFDPRDHGSSSLAEHYCMVREPQKANSTA